MIISGLSVYGGGRGAGPRPLVRRAPLDDLQQRDGGGRRVRHGAPGHGGPLNKRLPGAAATGFELARGRPTCRRPPLTQTFPRVGSSLPPGASGPLHPVRIPASAVGRPFAVGISAIIGGSMLDSAAEAPPAPRFTPGPRWYRDEVHQGGNRYTRGREAGKPS